METCLLRLKGKVFKESVINITLNQIKQKMGKINNTPRPTTKREKMTAKNDGHLFHNLCVFLELLLLL